MRDLRILPKVRDSWTYLYVEHARINQEHAGIFVHDGRGRTHVPCASLSLLMLGAGYIRYACGHRYNGGSGVSRRLGGRTGGAILCTGTGPRRAVQRTCYARYVCGPIQCSASALCAGCTRCDLKNQYPAGMTLASDFAAKKAARVRSAYAAASDKFGVNWTGRHYKRDAWDAADPVNRALSAANACLYGVCHAAIVALGYSPAIGFIHTGKMLSFVYDISDLYKIELAVPVAFEEASRGTDELESRVRHRCRDAFYEHRLLKRIVQDIEALFGELVEPGDTATDEELALPSELWDPDGNARGRTQFRRRRVMVVLMVESAPPSLRGEPVKWMLEPKAGVYVGSISGAVRDLLWDKVCASVARRWQHHDLQRLERARIRHSLLGRHKPRHRAVGGTCTSLAGFLG